MSCEKIFRFGFENNQEYNTEKIFEASDSGGRP